MVLVHDDDLTRLDGIYGNIVSRSSVHCTIELMFFYLFSAIRHSPARYTVRPHQMPQANDLQYSDW